MTLNLTSLRQNSALMKEAAAVNNSWNDLISNVNFKTKTIGKLKDLYREADLVCPEFVYCDSPKHALQVIWERKNAEAIVEEGGPISPILKKDHLNTILDQALCFNVENQKVCCFPYEEICYICEQPVGITISVEYRDGWKETVSTMP